MALLVTFGISGVFVGAGVAFPKWRARLFEMALIPFVAFFVYYIIPWWVVLTIKAQSGG